MHNPKLHALKLLKQYFYQQHIDKTLKARKLVLARKDSLLDTEFFDQGVDDVIGRTPQDKFMILKVLSSQQILVALDEVLNENRLNNHRHARGVPRRIASITKKVRKKGNTPSETTPSSNYFG